jgi:hypothetical protein
MCIRLLSEEPGSKMMITGLELLEAPKLYDDFRINYQQK